MTTTAPRFDSRQIGLAHYATRAILERVLARHDAAFPQWIILRLALVAEEPLERAALAGQATDALKIGLAEAEGHVDALLGAGLIEQRDGRLHGTEAARERYARVSAETAVISERVYRDLPADDLAATARVLTTVKERADKELAALAAAGNPG
jgi:DNA-binding MarR family transcriptional regulator